MERKRHIKKDIIKEHVQAMKKKAKKYIDGRKDEIT